MKVEMHILLVDDEPDFSRGLSRLISVEYPEIQISTASSGEEALAAVAGNQVDLVITDLRMPGMDGITLSKKLLEIQPGIKVVLLTGYGTIEKAVEAVRLGAFDFLTKPVASDQLYSTLNKVREYIRLEQENSRLKKMLEGNKSDILLGQSPAMLEVQKSLQMVAVSDYPVLIFGESGTGKELASRMVHQLSNRSDKPFIAVNCPAIPDSLMESELFGYTKGAFTGADKDRDGLIQSANLGTLHLDEIGDISHAMQLKLLRFLQEGEVRPVGSTKTYKTDVRIIASTNQQLEEKVNQNTFRADLYYRLNVVTIHLPPLRERVEDIALLTRFFLDQTCKEMRIEQTGLEPDVLSYLSTKDWPGNVRELQNYIRRLVIFSGGANITMATVGRIENPGQAVPSIDGELGPYKMMKAAVADRFTKNYFEQLFKETSGNVSEAARISGLSRVAIQKLCQRLSLDPGKFR
ncbi:sigma-54-dependent transcriptional regulator [Desulfosediminicola ganghwensis]|uniref:sigma-54-dependent transcriptional regulator n=1 Tax=Desulfosediminicola ganghwensis TaxID=2569540 RepID=UPI0010ACF084|nr:sigma-54 dependent transcriptional regulator [Desulfosediminicola ganghwensis]